MEFCIDYAFMHDVHFYRGYTRNLHPGVVYPEYYQKPFTPTMISTHYYFFLV